MQTDFKPKCEYQHEQRKAGNENPDYCANCGHMYREHRNGKCPVDLD